jgi:hypothetical protein
MDSKQEKELREADAETEEYLYLQDRDVQHFLLEMCGNLEGEDLLRYIAHSRQEAARYKREREAEYARARKAVANLDPITRVRRIAEDVYNPYDGEDDMLHMAEEKYGDMDGEEYDMLQHALHEVEGGLDGWEAEMREEQEEDEADEEGEEWKRGAKNEED